VNWWGGKARDKLCVSPSKAAFSLSTVEATPVITFLAPCNRTGSDSVAGTGNTLANLVRDPNQPPRPRCRNPVPFIGGQGVASLRRVEQRLHKLCIRGAIYS
jgi:hypothetical protein